MIITSTALASEPTLGPVIGSANPSCDRPGRLARYRSSMLFGRDDERRLVERMIAEARAGHSGVLVLRGEVGVGKSALLEYAGASAEGMRVLRSHGVQGDAELPFAALHQLLRPLSGRLEGLPDPQAGALRGAFGLAPTGSVDRLLVALGVLTVLSEAADERPVLCLVDDAQWLDQPTADTLRFVAHRLVAERILLLFAVREGAADPFPGLPELRLRGLGEQAATALLAERYPELSVEIRERIVAETGGNPLALSDLPGALTEEQRAGQAPLLGPLPLPDHLQRTYLEQVRGLPETTGTALLAAAAEDHGELSLVLRAAAELGVGADAFDAAEAVGLVGIDDAPGGGRVVFRHPLMRAAVYRSAPFTRRLAVHRALARALDPETDADRRAWHLAAATTGPDESVAAELERSSQRARHRGGPAAAATALERAAWLSVSTTDRALRLIAAAEAANAAGHPGRAETLAGQAEKIETDSAMQARIRLLRATIAFESGSPATTHGLLLGGAAPISADHPELAASMLVDAIKNGWFSNDLARAGEAAAALEAIRLPEDSRLRPLVRTVLGLVVIFGRDGSDRDHAVTQMRQGVDARTLLSTDSHPLGTILTSLAATVLGDDADAIEVAESAVAVCRTSGQIGWLPLALQILASVEIMTGQHRFARANASEGLALAGTLGQDNRVCHFRCVLAWLDAVAGNEESCRELAARGLRHAETQRIAPSAALAYWALGLLDLGLGRPEQALEHLLPRSPETGGHPLVRIMQTPDLVEAATRVGAGDEVRPYLVRFEAWAVDVDRPWPKAAVARCRALLAADENAEEQFLAALRLHDDVDGSGHPRPYDRARTELLYGEWLRRVRRRADARMPLHSAAEVFEQLGAVPWARRANAELRATGRSLRTATPSTVATLTPQELQVVRLASTGASNREIAAQLFLSPRTVGYHLYKAFPKLGISSRAELAHLSLDG
ncbi:MAG: AAA family ATPase [Streptosporangiales bacterium]|nr:AAA family ATPase [Streptosporangiales bacterium]